MSKFSLLAGAMAVIAVSGFAFAQSSGNHAPDGGTRVTISSIFIPAAKNAPFQATVTLEVTRHLADGSTVVIQNHRLVMRDSQGDIFQERRTLVPQGVEPQVRSIEISKPSEREQESFFRKIGNLSGNPKRFPDPPISTGLMGCFTFFHFHVVQRAQGGGFSSVLHWRERYLPPFAFLMRFAPAVLSN
jgi:hypothetical protein